MSEEDPKPAIQEISRWDKFRSNTLKSIRISYMNWTYLPRWNGEEEKPVDKLFRYSHFPMATQLFTYFAYRAASQVICDFIVINRVYMEDSSFIQLVYSTSFKI